MKFVERDLTVYEKFFVQIDEAKRRDKRISAVSMSQAEYDEFYEQAMAQPNIQAIQELQHRQQYFGIAITVEEPKKAKK